jgi:mannose-6-phosphate isomerase
LAKKLHASFPEHYADPNHKPEIAIALTPFQAMCGFRSEHEIMKNITEIPELATVMGPSGADLAKAFSKEKLKSAYHALLTADTNLVSEQLEKLIKRTEGIHDVLYDSVRQISRDFPGDVGLFCLFLFNVVTLKPGEALFLAPNEPHAYFKCVCKACSSLGQF